MEEYLPGSSPLAGVYATQPGDIGMHLLVGPPEGRSEAGFTTRVMEAVLDRLFADPGVERVVVEPDARNTKSMSSTSGWASSPPGRWSCRTRLPCSASVPGRPSTLPAPHCHSTPDPPGSRAMTTAALESVTHRRHRRNRPPDPERWAAANRHLVRKALAEFSHERILSPEPLGPTARHRYRVISDDGSVEYRFSARMLELDHWSIADMSIRRLEAGHIPTCPRRGRRMACPPGSADSMSCDFITEFQAPWGSAPRCCPSTSRKSAARSPATRTSSGPGQPSAAELAAGVTGGAGRRHGLPGH